MLKLRQYQEEAKAAVNDHLATREDNPCIVLPTGSGKSLVIADMLHDWIRAYPQLRACVMAHRKELVEQNAEELRGLDPWLSVGIYSASLKKREMDQSITFASIDSVYNKAQDFAPFDVLLIDEAHCIPVRGEGKYRQFIATCKSLNQNLRVVGLTATPYRMGAGKICHKDHILNHECYEANVGDLIRQGYLSPLRTIRGDVEIDLVGVKKSAGEFNQKELAERVDNHDVVAQATQHMVSCVRHENRQSIIVFCINVEHCKHVAQELKKYGIDAPWIVGSTASDKRARLVRDFKEGRLQWLLSVDCFFEGFNAPRADCMAMLRPTESKGRWVQAVGRLLRLFPGKQFGLVLDYGQNIDRHGPIDIDEGQDVRTVTCHNCANVFSRAVRECPSCGELIPMKQIDLFREEDEKAERVRQMHTAIASEGALLNEPRVLDVERVSIRLHKKPGSPDSVRVQYHCGIQTVSEWVCIDHEGFPGKKSRQWMRDRGIEAPSVADVMARSDEIERQLSEITEKIEVKWEGKYLRVMGYELREPVKA